MENRTMDRPTYYAQFDGDEIDGKRFAIGDEVPKDADAGTVAYLVSIGRLAANKPAETNAAPAGNRMLPDDSDPRTATLKALADLDPASMTREQMVAHIADLQTDGIEDDQLRDAVTSLRARAAAPEEDEEEDGADDSLTSDEGIGTDNPPSQADADKAVLAGTIPDVTERLAIVTDVDQLARLKDAEAAGADRAGVSKAIDARIAALAAV